MKNRMAGGIVSDLFPRAAKPLPETDAPEAALLRVPLPEGEVCVKEGDAVTVGQALCVGVMPVYAPASGRVASIGTARTGGVDVRAAVLENDGEYRLSPDVVPFEEGDEAAQLAFLRGAGIEDRGRALADLIGEKRGKTARLVLNFTDDEPLGGLYASLFFARGEEIMDGAKILLRLLACRECDLVFGLQSVDALNEAERLCGGDPLFRVCSVKARYPVSFPKALPSALFGSGSGKKCVVLDGQTVLSVYERFAEGLPFVRRFVLVGGDRAGKPHICQVPLGYPLSALFEEGGGEADLFEGRGAMTARAASPAQSVVGKGTEGALALSRHFGRRNAFRSSSGSCIGCGRCQTVCPSLLDPAALFRAGGNGRYDLLVKEHLSACLLCGCCEYVCPMRLPLRRVFASAIEALDAQKKAKEEENRAEAE